MDLFANEMNLDLSFFNWNLHNHTFPMIICVSKKRGHNPGSIINILTTWTRMQYRQGHEVLSKTIHILSKTTHTARKQTLSDPLMGKDIAFENTKYIKDTLATFVMRPRIPQIRVSNTRLAQAASGCAPSVEVLPISDVKQQSVRNPH
ncbi:hypothetical protein WN51_12301 [Melipona quadrifasciata]|uniref:Uncharacterized protein n=1 Tax=Melipona quadrifasciata TaxID=166423 RepID=A0A0M9ADV8_9HYME|nr:hypothetical protein WN51_12301 [Melipona quadrifasciata]